MYCNTRRSVERNRLKRLLRESYRQNKHQLLKTCIEKNFSWVLIFTFKNLHNISAKKISYKIVEKEVITLIDEIKNYIEKKS